MTEDQLQLRVGERVRSISNGDGVVPGGSMSRRLAGSQSIANPPVRAPRRMLFIIVVLVLTVGLASVWTFLAHQQLTAAVTLEAGTHLDVAKKSFDSMRTQIQAGLQSQCRVLVEDPRLKATLATEGMDAATVADILKDLGTLRGSGFLMVLSPDGRVFAEAGAPELQKLDLSASSVVKKAQTTADAVAGSWVLAGKVIDLSVKSVRYGDSVIAYLVVGQPVDMPLLRAVAEQTGVAVASALASNVVLASSTELAPVFANLASQPGGFPVRPVASNGVSYVASAVELAETAQAHRLLLIAPVTATAHKFELVKWMIFAPPLLVLIAVLFSLTGMRSGRN